MGGHPAESLSDLRDNTEWGCRDNLRKSFTPSRPANTNEILEEIPMPLRVLDDREASEVQGRLVLVNFWSGLSSFEQGGALW